MNAIVRPTEETSCQHTASCETEKLSRSAALDSSSQPCGSNSENQSKTSSWGGPRPGFGGPQPGSGRPRKDQRVIQSRPLGERWHVVEVFGGQEQRVTRDLLEGESRPGYVLRPEFRVHAPTIAVERRIRGEHRVEHRSMFPGYVFVLFDRTVDGWSIIKHVDGVRGVIATRSGIPLPLPAGFVEWLIKDAPSRLRLAETKMPTFEPGQHLLVEDGPFARFYATCISCDGRVTAALVSIFGRDTRVEMARRLFSAA